MTDRHRPVLNYARPRADDDARRDYADRVTRIGILVGFLLMLLGGSVAIGLMLLGLA